MVLIRSTLVGVLLIFFVGPLHASQKDGRLVTLFEKLQNTDNSTEAHFLEAQIKEIWMENTENDLQVLMKKGVIALELRELPLAVQIFDFILSKDPEFAEAWNKRGLAYFLMNNLDNSYRDIKQVLLLEPRHFNAYSGLGFIYAKQKRYEDALDAFEKALEINPHFTMLFPYIKQLKKVIQNNRA